MTVDRELLEQKFANFSDEELQRRWAAGHLTVEAQTIAASEADSRGLALDPYLSQEEPVVQGDPVNPQIDEDYLGDWVSVVRNVGPLEAQILCSFLTAHGIPVTPGNADTVRTLWVWEEAMGGASVRVPNSLLQQARSLLSERARGGFTLEDSFDAGEPSIPFDEPRLD